MKQYKYVNVDYKVKDVVMVSVSEHRNLIDQYALQGYRFVGMIPTEVSATGCMRKMDLIFEKEEMI